MLGGQKEYLADEFETKFVIILVKNIASPVNSGSSANLLCISDFVQYKNKKRLNKGDEVITVAAGFPTTIIQ